LKVIGEKRSEPHQGSGGDQKNRETRQMRNEKGSNQNKARSTSKSCSGAAKRKKKGKQGISRTNALRIGKILSRNKKQPKKRI